MANYVYDDGALNFPKTDLVAVPVGADATKYVDADDWNVANQAIADIKSVLRGATWIAFGENAADPAPAGLSEYVWLDTADMLWLHSSGKDSPLAGGGHHREATTAYTATKSDRYVRMEANNSTLTLPPTPRDGFPLTIWNNSNTGLTIAASGGDTTNVSSSGSGTKKELVYDASNAEWNDWSTA